VRRCWTLRIHHCGVESVFATIADVERYPDFLPGLVESRIIQRDPGRWQVENAFGHGLLQSRFLSHAEFEPPTALTIRSSDGPFRQLVIQWRVRQEERSCLLSCDTTLDFRSPLLAVLAGVGAAEMEQRVIASFSARFGIVSREADDGAWPE